MPKPSLSRGPLFLLAAAFATVSGVVSAGDKPAAAEKKQAQVEFGGMTIAIDPDTGRIRALSPEQSQRLAAAMRLKLAALRARSAARQGTAPEPAARAADAPRSAVVGLEHLKYSTLSVAPDGTREFKCLTLSEHAKAAAAAAKDRE